MQAKYYAIAYKNSLRFVTECCTLYVRAGAHINKVYVMRIYRATIVDDVCNDQYTAAHQDKYQALLVAILSMHAKCSSANFVQGMYGAIEMFTPPSNYHDMIEYLFDLGYEIIWDWFDVEDVG